MLKKKLQRVNGVVIYMINLIDSLGLRPFLFVLCGVLFNLSIPNLTWGGFSLLTEARDWSEKKKKKNSEKRALEGEPLFRACW